MLIIPIEEILKDINKKIQKQKLAQRAKKQLLKNIRKTKGEKNERSK